MSGDTYSRVYNAKTISGLRPGAGDLAIFSQDVQPAYDITYDFGNPNKRWKSIYVNNTFNSGFLSVGGQLSADSATITNSLTTGNVNILNGASIGDINDRAIDVFDLTDDSLLTAPSGGVVDTRTFVTPRLHSTSWIVSPLISTMGFTQVDKFYASRVDDTISRTDSNAAAKFDGSIACAKRVWSNNLLADSGIQSFGTLSVTGITTLSSTLSVVGNTTLGATLGVTGATTLSSNLTINNGSFIQNASVSNESIIRARENSSNTVTDGGGVLELYGTRSDGSLGTYARLKGGRENSALNNRGYFSVSVASADGNTPLERLRIIQNGNVGIGTSSPVNLLHVDGTVSNDYVLRVVNQVSTGNYHGSIAAMFPNQPTSSVQVGLTTGLSLTNNNAAELRFGYTSSGSSSNYLGIGWSGNINSPFCVTAGGNVGIGTTTPEAGLHVQSPISASPTGFGVLMGREGNNACIQLNSPSGSNNYIDFSNSGTDQLYRLIHNVTSNTLQFQNQTFATSIFMNSDGRVAIGGSTLTTGCHLTIPSGGNVDVVRAIRGEKVLGKLIDTYTVTSTDSGDPNPLTYSASAVYGGIINRQGMTGNVTDTLCSATDLATQIASNSFSVAANQSIELIIRNPSSFLLTINAGTGGTMVGVNTIAAGSNKLFLIRMTSSSAYTVYAL